MLRLALFLGIVCAGLALVAALNWWVDPLGEFYEASVVADAGRSHPACLVAVDLLGTPTWPAFKEDLVRRRGAQTIVIGTSRVLKLRARPGERHFVNAGMPGTGPETLVPLLRRLHAATPARATVLLGVEPFWFNRTWRADLVLDRSLTDTVGALLSRDTARTSLETVKRTPTVLEVRHRRAETAAGCVLERADRVEHGGVDAWALDGSFEYRFELAPSPTRVPDDDYTRDLVRFATPYYAGWSQLDPERIEALERALELARSWGWKVVGFSPPYAPRYVDRLATAPETAARWSELGAQLPALFRRHGFAYADLRDVRDVPCRADAFVDDGWHVDDACAARVRAALDRAAATVAP
jgi:hypothetical protein